MAMEIHFEQSQLSAAAKPAKMKSKGRGSHQAAGGKFVGVRQRPSGRWVAEIKDTTQKIRMWLGTFETAEAAARAYDEAACLLRGSNTRTNFVHPRGGGGAAVASNSPIAARIRGLLHHRKLAKAANPAPPQPPPPSTIVPAASSATTSVAASSPSSSLSSSSSPSSRTATTTTGCDHTSINVPDSIKTTTTTTAARRQVTISHIRENQTTEMAAPDHVYRPCFGNGNSEVLHLGASSSSSSSDFSWLFDSAGIERLPAFTLQEEGPPLELPGRHGGVVFEEGGELGLSELERMKVERQISASLYAINGVHEYLEAVHDPSDVALWDLPPLCQLFCHA